MKYVSPARLFLIAAALISAVSAVLLYWYSARSLEVAYLVGVSTSGFILCGYDKTVAGGGSLRVPEQVLLVVATAGGSLGIALAMVWFRHKVRKARFKFFLGLIMALQLLLILSVLGRHG